MKRLPTLGLPLGDPPSAWLLVVSVLGVYAATMQRGLGGFDSPELALVAQTLGLGHPPGQPLHTLLGFLFSHLPGVPALIGLNLLSALSAALGLLAVLSLSDFLLAADADHPLTPRARRLGYAAVGIAALHGALWEPATRIEVYTLAGFFALWACARLASLLDPAPGAPAAGGRGYLAVGTALGLSASANPMIASLLALSMGPALLQRLLRGRLSGRNLGLALAGGPLGLLPYAYVGWVAERRDALVWGQPEDAARLWHYFSFADFAQNNRLGPQLLLAHLGDWLGWTASAGVLPLLACGIGGFAWLGRGRGLGASLALSSVAWTALFVCSNVVWKLDNPDLLAYLGVPLALCTAGLGALVARVSSRRAAGPAALAALAVLVLVAPPPLLTRTRQRDRFSDLQAEATLAQLPANALLISESDHLAAAILYLQLARGRRRDVAHLVYGLASSSWHWEHLFRIHPELRPIPLRGPGGRHGRVQRLLQANAERAVFFERIELAGSLAQPLCAAGWSIGSGDFCGGAPHGVDPRPNALLRQQRARIGDGSPGTDSLIAMVALQRGQALWRMGHGAAALEAMRAGVARDALPAVTLPEAGVLDRTAAPASWPDFRRPAVLGDPARNLFMAGALLHAAGAGEAAAAHLLAARALGLPEASTPTPTR